MIIDIAGKSPLSEDAWIRIWRCRLLQLDKLRILSKALWLLFHSTGTDHSRRRVGSWRRPYHPFLVSVTNWNLHKTLNNYLNPLILERTEFEFINILRIWYILHETDSKGCYKISRVMLLMIQNNSTGSISLVCTTKQLNWIDILGLYLRWLL